MASLPTGSDKLLEIKTEDVCVVIKSAKKWHEEGLGKVSSVHVEGRNINSVYLKPESKRSDFEISELLITDFSIEPLFFEQTDYEIIISSEKGSPVSFYNENHIINDSVGNVKENDNSLISGVINFGNLVGYTDLVVLSMNRKVLSIRIEVFPSKISYKQDYCLMINDISEMISEAALDFMQKTYRTFSISNNNSSLLSVYFQILSVIFKRYISAVRRIISVPHHKLISEHYVVPAYKAKRTDHLSEKWLIKHPDHIALIDSQIYVDKVLSSKKQITYDTLENRFVKYILLSTVNKLELFKKRYINILKHTETDVLDNADSMITEIRRSINQSFLHDVSDFSTLQSMSLVFGMAPGYRELYRCFIVLQKSLTVNGDVFRMSTKDTARLYEYWCFIKLFNILKKKYDLITPDIVHIDNNGITIRLKQGTSSEARFYNQRTNEVIILSYNPSESKTQTVNQRPDNVLELEKTGSDFSYKYVFDAKYRIESYPDESYPDSNPGPKVEDINTMHRYRDSIVYENPNSKFTFEKTMFGAYILFPYSDEKKYSEYESVDNGKIVKGHRFYRSIDSVNIGGLPFLPGSTKLVEKLLSDLITDSKESAFERTTLPIGIEDKLAKVDWNIRDVLIGTFRSVSQFDICFKEKFYYIPEKQIAKDRLPIHYVALYQTNTKFDNSGEIRYYGEVIGFERVKRKDIADVPITHNNPDEMYYRMFVKEWKDISQNNISGKPILPRESGFVADFTNMFLLQHCDIVPELQLKSEEEYRFYSELKRNAEKAVISDNKGYIGFDKGECKYTFTNEEILVMKDNKIIAKANLQNFSKRPAQTFRLLQYYSIQ